MVERERRRKRKSALNRNRKGKKERDVTRNRKIKKENITKDHMANVTKF